MGLQGEGKRLRMSMEWFCVREREGNVMLLLWLDTGKRNNAIFWTVFKVELLKNVELSVGKRIL